MASHPEKTVKEKMGSCWKAVVNTLNHISWCAVRMELHGVCIGTSHYQSCEVILVCTRIRKEAIQITGRPPPKATILHEPLYRSDAARQHTTVLIYRINLSKIKLFVWIWIIISHIALWWCSKDVVCMVMFGLIWPLTSYGPNKSIFSA
jgi:hypothetical protein